ncbi:MAG: PAS domain S-box protein [Candidatus Sumerlaeia bacterium]|nr:PAS domain S-box protein [Candidatus Sumerlaeia bacterium]
MSLGDALKNVVSRRALGHVLSEYLRREFGHDAFFLSHYTLEERALRPIYGEDTPEGEGEPQEVPIDPLYDIVLRDEPLLINRDAPVNESEFDPFGDRHRMSRSLLFCPIFHNGRKIGSMSIQSYTPNHFGEADVARLAAIAAECGSAVQRVREEELQTQLWRAFDQSPAMILVTDIQGRIDYANPLFLKKHGYRISEIQGRTPSLFKSGTIEPAVYTDLWETILAGGQWSGDLENKRSDGSLFWVHTCISPIIDADGEQRFFLAMMEDVTDQHLREEERKKRGDIIEAVAYAAARFTEPTDWQTDLSEILLRIGKAADADRAFVFENIAGSEGEPMMNLVAEWNSGRVEPLASHGMPLQVPYLEAGMRGLFKAMCNRAVYTRNIKDADKIELEYMKLFQSKSYCAIPIYLDKEWDGFIGISDSRGTVDWSPQVLNALWIAANVIAATRMRLEIQNELKYSEDTTRTLLDASPDIAMLLDWDGCFLAVNSKAVEFFGYPARELVHRRCLDFLPCECVEQLEKHWIRCLEEREPIEFAVQVNGNSWRVIATPILPSLEKRDAKLAVYMQPTT